MRKSLGLVVGLVSLFGVACGGLVDQSEEDGVGSQASAFGGVVIPPPPTANPVPYSPIIKLERPGQPKTPIGIVQPTPAPVLATISGWGGTFGQHGHTDGSQYTRFDIPSHIAVHPDGTTWVVDQDSVDPAFSAMRLIKSTRGSTAPHVQTVFKVQTPGAGLSLNNIGGMAANPDDVSEVYATDTYWHTIVRIKYDGSSQVVVGNGVGGMYPTTQFLPPADGDADHARFTSVRGIAFASSGVMYVADKWNNAIRKVTTAGDTTTLGTAPPQMYFYPDALAVDKRDGTAYAVSQNAIFSVSPAGVVALYAGQQFVSGYQNGPAASALFKGIKEIAVDRSGNVYVADYDNQVIRKIVAGIAGAAPTVETVPTLAPFDPNRWTLDGYGWDENVIEHPYGLAFWGDRLVFSDSTRPTIRIAN